MFVTDRFVAIETAKKRVEVGTDTASGVMFADYLVRR